MFKAIQIQTMQGCNKKCGFCPNSYLPQTGEKMPEELFYNLIDQLSEMDYQPYRVSPYLMNEPLLDDRLVKFCKYIKEKLPAINLMVATNGILLSKKKAEELSKYVDNIRVSCYNKETEYKVLCYHLEKINTAKCYTEEYKKLFFNRGGNIDVGQNKLIFNNCPYPHLQMYINYKGQAILCCSDYKFEVIMGDATKEKLIDIWGDNGSNKLYKLYRNNLKQHDRRNLLLCRTCNKI